MADEAVPEPQAMKYVICSSNVVQTNGGNKRGVLNEGGMRDAANRVSWHAPCPVTLHHRHYFPAHKSNSLRHINLPPKLQAIILIPLVLVIKLTIT